MGKREDKNNYTIEVVPSENANCTFLDIATSDEFIQYIYSLMIKYNTIED